jgi:hypothetical protein
VSQQQAKKLKLKPRKRLSPWIEKSCLLLSANVSYENAARDFEELTGIAIGHSTQQRLVHRTDWEAETATVTVNALSVDGGKARIRTPEKGPSIWLDDKAVSLHGIRCDAWFQDNEALLESVNSQPLAPVVSCIGDGHPGVWKIVAGIKPPEQRREVLDWFHLMENLHKVGGSEQRRIDSEVSSELCASRQRLKQVRLDLWQGRVAGAKAAFDDWIEPPSAVVNFLQYVEPHQARIPDYQSDQAQGLRIGSGSVESTIKRIGVRIKISGGQWKAENVGRVLKQRCAYLNRFAA